MPAGKVTEIALPPTSGPGSWTPAWITGSARLNVQGVERIYLGTTGPHVLALHEDGLAAYVAHTFAAPFSSTGMAVFNNRIWFSGGNGLAYIDGATGIASAVSRTVSRAQLASVTWRPLGVPTPVLFGISDAYNFNSVRWCPITADPMDDTAWSAPVRIGGDGRYRVNSLAVAPRHVYMLRPDGVWDMDELGARAFNVAPWVEEAVDYFNGGWGLHIGDGLYYSHSQGLAFVPTSGEAQYGPEWAHPGWGLPYEGPVRGRINTGTLHNGWGLVGQWSESVGGESYVLAGRRDQDAAYGAASHVWHGAEAVIPSAIQHMKVYTMGWASGQPQTLMTTGDDGSPPVVKAYWQSLSKSGTPLQEMLWGGGFVPAAAASLFLPADPWDRPSAVKTMLQFEMVTERLSTNDTLKVYAAADSGSWADQGTADGGDYTSFAPLELTEGRFIRTRVDALGSPILRSLELRAAVGVELREARVYRVVLGYDNALKTPRGRETRDPEQRMLDLKTMLGRVVTLEDGYPMRVRVLQVMAPERRQLGTANRPGAWALVCPIMVSILDHPFRYDGPASNRYDSDRAWS